MDLKQVIEWREVQDGWAINLGNGASALIQVKRKGGVAYVLAVSGACDTVAEAQERLEQLATRLDESQPIGANSERLPAVNREPF